MSEKSRDEICFVVSLFFFSVRITMSCKKWKIHNKKWRQTSVKHYFLATNFSKSNINYCEDCRRKFESRYHLKYHLSTTAPCRDPYVERSKDAPHTLLQNMSDEILYLVSDYLLLRDLVSFIQALPRLLICHGMKTLWMRRTNHRHPRFTPGKMRNITVGWLMYNEIKLLSIDHFIYVRCQGDNDSHAVDVVDWQEYHRLFVKNSRPFSWLLTSDKMSCSRQYAHIWNFQDSIEKWRRKAISSQREYLATSERRSKTKDLFFQNKNNT